MFVNKSDFITKIDQTWMMYISSWENSSEEKMVKPGTCGPWSVKDLIAHVTWYEQEMIAMLSLRALKGSPLWEVSPDQRNAVIQEEYKGRPLHDVLIESKKVHQIMMDLLHGMQENELLEASCFREMPSDWVPWQVIASNTFEHYSDHLADIHRSFPE